MRTSHEESMEDELGPRPFPRRFFTDGMFRVFLMPSMVGCFVAAAVWAFIVQWLFWKMATSPESIGGAVLRVGCWVGEIIVALVGFSIGSTLSLSMIRDMANGCDRIRTWPSLNVMDWFIEAIYVFNAACVSALPGWLICWILSKCHVSMAITWPWALLLALGLFPFVLMSMLENASPLGTISEATLHTVRIAREAWLAFYLVSTGLWMTLTAVLLLSFLFSNFFVHATIASLVVAFSWLIYFRMIGRLACYCTERTRGEAEEEEEAESEEELALDESQPVEAEPKKDAAKASDNKISGNAEDLEDLLLDDNDKEPPGVNWV